MKISKNLKVYSAFARGSIKGIMTYKANVMMGVIGQLLMVTVTFFLWKAIYKSSDTGIIEGFTLNEMLVYVMITFVISIVVFADTKYIISQEVKDGSIAMSLIKPISYTKRIMAMAIGQFIFSIVFLFLPAFILVTAYGLKNGLEISAIKIILFLISIVLGFFINAYYSYLFGLLAFKFYNLWGISQIADAVVKLVSGALIPLTFFPETIGRIFQVLPFSSIIYTPAMIYLNKLNGIEIFKALIIQVVWIGIMMFIAKIVWNKLIDKLAIQGG